MADEHDSWMQGLGIDIGQLRQAAQSVKNEALASVGVAPETLQKLDAAGRTIDDFNKGVGEGIMSGVGDLLELTPPVLLVKNAMLVGRVASADDPEEEFKKVVGEKIDSAVSIGTFGAKLVTDPVGTGTAIGEHLGKEFVKANAEGHGAEFVGKGVGRGIVIAATVAVGAGEAEGAAVLAEAGEGAAVAAGEGGAIAAGEGGAIAAGEGGAIAAGEGGAVAAGEGGAAAAGEEGAAAASAGRPVVPAEPFDPAPSFVDPAAPTVPGEPPTLRTPGPEPFDPAPSANPAISPAADSVPPPTLRAPGPEPFEPAPSVNDPIPSTEPGEPPTLRTPGPEPFEPAPSVDNPIPSTEPGEPPTLRTPEPASPDPPPASADPAPAAPPPEAPAPASDDPG